MTEYSVICQIVLGSLTKSSEHPLWYCTWDRRGEIHKIWLKGIRHYFLHTSLELCENSISQFNMPTAYQQWVWEREVHINWSMVTCHGSTHSELPPVLSTCLRHTNSGCGKERRILIGPW